MLGLKSGTVKIVKYNPEWAIEFEKEKSILSTALEGYKVDIQHVGSTSILFCSAKPIIDIAIGVPSLKYGEKLIPILESIGYTYDGDAGLPGRHFFKKCNGEIRTHYIHVEKKNDRLWLNHINFRDYLNTHPELVEQYSKLKVMLEKKYANSRDQYTREKDPFIAAVLKQAETK